MNQSTPSFTPFTAPAAGLGSPKICVLWCDPDLARIARAKRLLADRAIVESVPDAAAAVDWAGAVLPDLAVACAAAARAVAAGFGADRRTSGIPLVLLADTEAETAALARDLPALDILVEPIADHALAARIGAQIEILSLRRALAEREAESETWLGLALRASGLGVWHARLSSGELHMDANLAAMFGWPREPRRVRDADWLARIHPEDRARVMAELSARRQDHRPLEIDFRTALPDGTNRSLAVLGAVVRHAENAGAPGTAFRSVGVARDVTDRVRDAERLKLLLGELNHRVRNTLASVVALAQQTAYNAPSVEAFIESFRARGLALGAAPNLLTRGQWQGVALGDLVETILAPERSARAAGNEAGRIEISGPTRELAPQQALAMTLGLHELATNARKYGALATQAGRLEVRWSIVADGAGHRLTLVWRERGGAPVMPPTRSGFGTRLLRRSLGRDLGGSVRLDFDPAGLVCTFEFQLPPAG